MKVLISGCNGKMGQILANKIGEYEDLLLIGGVDRTNKGLYSFPVYTNINDIEELPDIIIDFSVPECTINILDFCKKYKLPIVIATTGFTQQELNFIKECSNFIPIFQSSNMSYSVNLMKKIVAEIAIHLYDSDIEIIETHHNKKIDAPSGTAKLLADSINDALNNQMIYIYNRNNSCSKRQKNEIGFSSIRGGNIVGEHVVKFFSNSETFEIKHTSHSREIFAYGAIKAANFLISKTNGLYDMDDL